MKKRLLGLSAAMSLCIVSTAWAVPAGMMLEYTESPMGKVIFSGDSHVSKGLTCDACHPALFEQKKGAAKITMPDHQAGKFCFACHNGSQAFAAEGNCNLCHKK